MKKFLIAGAAILVIVAALGAAGLVYAQSGQAPQPPYGMGRGGMMGSGYGAGMMGGRGMMGGAGTGMMGSGSYGPMHTYMVAALAEELGLSIEEIQSRIDQGETPYQIAQAQGLTDKEIASLMERAHDAALDAAVEAGTLTQAQADWMDQRMGQMWQSGGTGFGPCHAGAAGSSGTGGMMRPWNQQPAQPTN